MTIIFNSVSPEASRPVALITGSSRGIGLAIAEQLALAGFSIALNGRRESLALDEAVTRLKKFGGEVVAFPFDVSDIAVHGAKVQEIALRLGRLDCLINNAGVSVQRRGDLLDVTPESFDEQIDINLRSHFFLTQTIARWMIANPCPDFRSIVSISSSNAEAVALERGEYCIAKTGLSMMTKLFAVRLAREGINVYEVRPGLIATDMTAPVKAAYDFKLKSGFSPLNRWGTPQDVAKVVKALVLGDFAFTTGDAIHVDGGLLVSRY